MSKVVPGSDGHQNTNYENVIEKSKKDTRKRLAIIIPTTVIAGAAIGYFLGGKNHRIKGAVIGGVGLPVAAGIALAVTAMVAMSGM